MVVSVLNPGNFNNGEALNLVHHVPFLLRRSNEHSSALYSRRGTSGSSKTMDVSFSLSGTNLQNKGDVRVIDSTSGHIRGEHDNLLPHDELFGRSSTVLLRLARMHFYGCDRVGSSEKISHEGSELGSNAEDHNFEVFRVFPYFNSNLLEDSVAGGFNRGDHNFLTDLGVSLLLVFRNAVQESVVFLNSNSSYLSNFRRNGGGEEQSLTFGLQKSNNTRNGRLETEFEHLIGLIKDKNFGFPDHISEAFSVVEMVF
jgi:hypothetical protein